MSSSSTSKQVVLFLGGAVVGGALAFGVAYTVAKSYSSKGYWGYWDARDDGARARRRCAEQPRVCRATTAAPLLMGSAWEFGVIFRISRCLWRRAVPSGSSGFATSTARFAAAQLQFLKQVVNSTKNLNVL